VGGLRIGDRAPRSLFFADVNEENFGTGHLVPVRSWFYEKFYCINLLQKKKESKPVVTKGGGKNQWSAIISILAFGGK
jgi:hypothetical protein